MNSRKWTVKVEWGGVTWYLDNGMFSYCWDGGVNVENGKLKQFSHLDIKMCGHGIKTDRRYPIDGSSWHSLTKDNMDGVVLEIEGTEDTLVKIHTVQKNISFTLGELLERKHLRWDAGAKYSAISIAAMLDGEGPFDVNGKVAEGCLDIRLKAEDFKGAKYYGQWQRDFAAWLATGDKVTAEINLPRSPVVGNDEFSFFTLELRAGLAGSPEKVFLDKSKYSPFNVKINEREIEKPRMAFRATHPIGGLQYLEFIKLDVPSKLLREGENLLTIENKGDDYLVIISAQVRESIQEHLQITSAPKWLLAGDEFEICIRALRDDTVEIKGKNINSFPASADLKKGINRIKFQTGDGTGNVVIDLGRGETIIPVYALERENTPWVVGPILQNVKHDETDEVGKAIRYVHDTQMGNHVQFRVEPFMELRTFWSSTDGWTRWIELCVELGIYFSMNSLAWWPGLRSMSNSIPCEQAFLDVLKIMKEHGKEYFFSCHIHELGHWLYVYQPGSYEPGAGANGTMRDAMGQYIKDIAAIETVEGIPRQTGQATALACYDYESGIDYIAVETMALNAMHLFAGASGAAKAFGKKRWGVYNAVYWAKTPEDFTKLTLSYVNWYLAYLWGGNMAISEEGHFRITYSGHQQGWDSEETTRLRQIMRNFYRFVNTHPRRGKSEVNLAIAQGNLSSEILSLPMKFMNAKKTISHVWGAKGGLEEKWDYGDPEKGMELLDVFMPYHKDGENIRHWFTGTPYGIFDMAPVAKASQDILDSYKVLIFLGWNTMTPEIYEKLKSYVKNGGILFMALPHLSMHEDRKFLLDMQDLDMIKGGNFEDLFGLKVTGKREKKEREWIACNWKEAGREKGFPYWKEYRINTPIADVKLKTAKPLIVDKTNDCPVLTGNSVGKGKAYLLTTWAYPGNASLEGIMRDILNSLGEKSKGDVYVEDHSQEVAWSVWKDKDKFTQIFALNTDWTEEGNVKKCRLMLAGKEIPVNVREGNITTVSWRDDIAVFPKTQELFIENIICEEADSYRIIVHGQEKATLFIHALRGQISSIDMEQKPIECIYSKDQTCAEAKISFENASRLHLVIKVQSD